MVLAVKAVVECGPQGAEKGSGNGKEEVEGGWNLVSEGGETGIPASNTEGKERLLEPVSTEGRWEQGMDSGEVYGTPY